MQQLNKATGNRQRHRGWIVGGTGRRIIFIRDGRGADHAKHDAPFSTTCSAMMSKKTLVQKLFS